MELRSTSPWPARQDLVLDGSVLLALMLLAWVLPLFLPNGIGPSAPIVGSVGFVVVSAVVLATIRRPSTERLVYVGALALALVVLTFALPGQVATADDPTNLWMPLAPTFPTYAAHLYSRDRRRAWIVTALAAVVVVRPYDSSATIFASGLLYVSAPMLFGLYLTARRMLVATLTERAERAEHERDLLAERARTEERVRLAADLHDIVTHRISLMVLHAGALRITATDDETRDAAEEVRSTGCQALEELRDLIGVLRAPRERPTAPASACRQRDPEATG